MHAHHIRNIQMTQPIDLFIPLKSSLKCLAMREIIPLHISSLGRVLPTLTRNEVVLIGGWSYLIFARKRYISPFGSLVSFQKKRGESHETVGISKAWITNQRSLYVVWHLRRTTSQMLQKANCIILSRIFIFWAQVIVSRKSQNLINLLTTVDVPYSSIKM